MIDYKEFIKKYNYYLPRYLIARYPPYRRGFTDLMIYYTQTNDLIFTKYYKLYKFIPSGTLAVRNVSKVFKARLFVDAYFIDGQSYSDVEIFILSAMGKSLEDSWPIKRGCLEVSALVRLPWRKLKRLSFFKILNWKIFIEPVKSSTRERILRFCNPNYKGKELREKFVHFLDNLASVPIPPYLERQAERVDEERYQAVFAQKIGSAAAPTASLNFTPGLEKRMRINGIDLADVVLHVGLGTFLPVSESNLEENRLHTETVVLDKKNFEKIYLQKLNDNPILAIGTTVVRALETLALDFNLTSPDLKLPQEYVKHTNLFIRPPRDFRVVDMLLTNFHLPQSSLIMLVDAFLQYKRARLSWRQLYQEAIKRKFKFYSYGDSMLII